MIKIYFTMGKTLINANGMKHCQKLVHAIQWKFVRLDLDFFGLR